MEDGHCWVERAGAVVRRVRWGMCGEWVMGGRIAAFGREVGRWWGGRVSGELCGDG